MTIPKRSDALKKEVTSAIMLIGALIFGLMMSGEISEYVRGGLTLAVSSVIPTSLPFMIISDLYVFYGRPENITALRKTVCPLFGISPHGLSALICGNVGGFPIGAKMSADCYLKGLISKEDAERLIPLSNNPSCAFIVGGVGMGIYRDMRVGILLAASVYSATLLCAVIMRPNKCDFNYTDINIGQNYSFVESVKAAGISSIGIISFISIFSAINGILKKRVKYAPLLYGISAILEVTNAVQIYSSDTAFPSEFMLSLSAFALGFGGMCVGMQSAVFTSSAGLKMKKYYLVKLLEGVLSLCVFSILFIVTKK